MHRCILICAVLVLCGFFFFNQKTAYEMRISDWSSDVCSSDLSGRTESARSAGRFEPYRRAPTSTLGRSERRPECRGSESLREGGEFRAHPHSPCIRRSEESRVGKECGSKCRYRR